ncbi:hypothetical protein CIP106467_0962 [Citrobacter europaeus]|nr:hypothetical protein CIP106467_0962 [Citrobacter europaeus]
MIAVVITTPLLHDVLIEMNPEYYMVLLTIVLLPVYFIVKKNDY